MAALKALLPWEMQRRLRWRPRRISRRRPARASRSIIPAKAARRFLCGCRSFRSSHAIRRSARGKVALDAGAALARLPPDPRSPRTCRVFGVDHGRR